MKISALKYLLWDALLWGECYETNFCPWTTGFVIKENYQFEFDFKRYASVDDNENVCSNLTDLEIVQNAARGVTRPNFLWVLLALKN